MPQRPRSTIGPHFSCSNIYALAADSLPLQKDIDALANTVCKVIFARAPNRKLIAGVTVEVSTNAIVMFHCPCREWVLIKNPVAVPQLHQVCQHNRQRRTRVCDLPRQAI